MIRPIDIRLNAAHPELPLCEAVTFTGAPSTVLIRGVPPNCGRWAITAVSVAATFPDGSTTTRSAVQSANGVWVATLPATARSGRTANGLRVLADGIDENGEAVTGYILGVADFAVASLGVAPAPEPGETSWQMLYFDAVPSALRKGDVTKVDGVLKLYNGTAWEPFAGDIPAPSTATPAMDGTGSAGSSAAFARGDHVHPTDTSRVPTSRKVNGIALANDVALTGADIAVSGTDATKIDAALAGKASTADATLTDASKWRCNPATDSNGQAYHVEWQDRGWATAWFLFAGDDQTPVSTSFSTDASATRIEFTVSSGTVVATRAALQGYQLGSQSDKPLASEAEAEALRTEVSGKANRAANPTSGNLAALDASGNPTDSTIPAADVALKSAIPYSLGTPIVIDAASSETVEGETVNYGAAALDNRTANIVQVTAATALDELRITFPAETSGKVRDFGLRVEIGTGSAALTAPALVPIAPTGETIKIENNAKEIPALADGTATAKGVTLLYFSENAPGVFVVKGEQVEEVA